jgi:cytochrome c peroxidase
MGMTLKDLVRKLAVEEFYPPLFEAAFGSRDITADRISLALAQFVRSMVSYRSKFDEAYAKGRNGQPNFRGVYNEKEMMGLELFAVVRGSRHTSQNCSSCHITGVQSGDNVRNNGLDDDTGTDKGAGAGRFKAPSLRNISVSGPYMHDGRFKTLRDVLKFYGEEVKAHSYLDNRLKGLDGEPRRPGFSEEEIEALLAFFDTLTDHEFLKDPKFSDPFPKRELPARDMQPTATE